MELGLTVRAYTLRDDSAAMNYESRAALIGLEVCGLEVHRGITVSG